MATASFTTHADRANLVTKPDDWASIDIDGTGLLKALEPSPGDIAIAKMGQPIHTTCCPSGTVEFIAGSNIGNNEKHNADDKSVSSSTPFPGSAAYEGCCDAVTATLRAMTTRMSTHAPKFLLLTGSLRADSCSRRVAVEAGRILASYGAEVKLFDPTDLPLFSQDVDPKTNAKVAELPALTRWCEGMVWVSPEVHGNFSAVFKNQIDWMPLTEGALRPTQGKTVAVMQVEAGSQSFNTVNNLRVLGRWMRMVVIPNQSSIPKAYTEFNEDGTLKEGLLRSRVVDVVDELFRYTLLLRDQQPLLLQRYSERTVPSLPKRISKLRARWQTHRFSRHSKIQSSSTSVPRRKSPNPKAAMRFQDQFMFLDGNPQSVHQTTAQEFTISSLMQALIWVHCLTRRIQPSSFIAQRATQIIREDATVARRC